MIYLSSSVCPSEILEIFKIDARRSGGWFPAGSKTEHQIYIKLTTLQHQGEGPCWDHEQEIRWSLEQHLQRGLEQGHRFSLD